MKADEINKILLNLENKNIYKKIFINGKWGIGKSHYIEKYVFTKNKKGEKKLNKNIVYISLFGKNNYDQILSAMVDNIAENSRLDKKMANKLKNFLKNSGINFSFSKAGFNLAFSYNVNIIKQFSSLLKKEDKKLIVVVDDFERKSENISLIDVLGLLEELSLYENVNIVLIADETKIIETEKWKSFKEKFIEKEYKIATYSDTAIEIILEKNISDVIKINNEIKEKFKEFFYKHNVVNLRTIIKGVGLFKEVLNLIEYTKIEESVRITLLFICLAIIIDDFEKQYVQEVENKEIIEGLPIVEETYEDKIAKNYLNILNYSTKSYLFINFIKEIYDSNIKDNSMEILKNLIKKYNKKDEPNQTFYLSEFEMKKKLKKIYNNIINKKYVFIDFDLLMDDIYYLIEYDETFKLNIDENNLKEHFNEILFDNVYKVDKTPYENVIDHFMAIHKESRQLTEFINYYNEQVNKRIYVDSLNKIKEQFILGNFDTNILKNLELKLIDNNINTEEEKNIKVLLEENNYFIPDLSKDILNNKWSWTHEIWRIIYNSKSDILKEGLNNYSDKKKNENPLIAKRIGYLQSYRPLK